MQWSVYQWVSHYRYVSTCRHWRRSRSEELGFAFVWHNLRKSSSQYCFRTTEKLVTSFLDVFVQWDVWPPFILSRRTLFFFRQILMLPYRSRSSLVKPQHLAVQTLNRQCGLALKPWNLTVRSALTISLHGWKRNRRPLSGCLLCIGWQALNSPDIRYNCSLDNAKLVFFLYFRPNK